MKHIYRSRKNNKILGICGGLGDYFNIDPSFLRIALVAILILTGIFPMLIAYLACGIFIPLAPPNHLESNYKKIYRTKKDAKFGGVLSSIARYFKTDPTLIRVFFIIILFITAIFPMLITYFAAWMIIPEKDQIEIDV